MAPSGVMTRVKGLKARAGDEWLALKEGRPGVTHLVRGHQHYKENHGDHLAAAITYFSFLAIFPLILLGASVGGFILASQPHLTDQLYTNIHKNVPGDFGTTLVNAVQSAIANRASVGVVAIAGLLLTGLGWIANLRTAIDTVWGLPEVKRNFLKKKLSDGLVLVGLAVGIGLSLGLTAFGTAAAGTLLRWANLDDVTGAGTVTAVLGIALGLAGDMIVFGWMLIRLPDVHVSRQNAIRTTLLAAVGFEVLKVIGTFYIARVIQSPALAAIAPVVGILVWIDLVSRFMLFCVAWSATATPASQPELLMEEVPPAKPAPALERPRVGVKPVSPIGLAAGLISAGAAVGGASVAAVQRRRRRGRSGS